MVIAVVKKEEGQRYWFPVKSPSDLDTLTTRLRGFAETAQEEGREMIVKIIFQDREGVIPTPQAHG